MDLLYAPNLKDCPTLRHAFFGRQGGVSEGVYHALNCGLSSADKPEHIAENRRRVAEALNTAPTHLLSCYQVHSTDVVTVTAPWRPEDRPRADAMVTGEHGLALGILTADCVPVLFADESAGIIGAAHAGWRGALSGVLENTVAAMEKLGARPARITAALGPCIAQKSYEVDATFPAPFLAEDPAHEKLFRAGRAGHYQFDLPAYVIAKLKNIGLRDIEPSPADTYADENRFFSYRRTTQRGENKVGLLISVIGLKKNIS